MSQDLMRPHPDLPIAWISTSHDLTPAMHAGAGRKLVEIERKGILWIDAVNDDGTIFMSVNTKFVSAIGYARP